MKIIDVFNTYLKYGGEEQVVGQIRDDLASIMEINSLRFHSKDWTTGESPGRFEQLRKMFYNGDSADSLRSMVAKSQPEALLFHNIYPVGSPALYHTAMEMKIPVIHYVHNFRPFSVSGSCWTGSEICEDGLRQHFLPEVLAGSWQGSQVKSAIFALLLKRLHRSGYLEAVKCWIAISEFMRQKFIQAGISPDKIVTLRHSWSAMEDAPERKDHGYYLLLARLVPEKGIKTALEAWLGMGEKGPKLIVAGTGPLTKEVEEAASSSKKIDYVGFVDGHQKTDLIAGCRGMLAPSVWWEPLGLVTYEAYDYGKPMLAAASGGLTETVVDGVTGFLHEPGNSDSLAESVMKLEALSSVGRQQMGAAGRDWLLREASPERWKQSFREIVEAVV